jgi:hypothetical protein
VIAGCEPLVLLGDRAPAKTTRIGDSDSVRFSDGEEAQESGLHATHH